MNDQLKELSILLSTSVFVPIMKASDKEGILAELSDLLVASNKIKVKDRDSILAALVDRESKMSTGMQYGLAIPHAKTDLVEKLVTTIAISPEGVEFGSLDGAPATIFIATLSPRSDANSHIKFLAEVSRQLSSRRIREQLLAAKTKEDMVNAICGTRAAE